MIDLRSDTVTRPDAGMRHAIAEAEVGDDTLGDDPTVRRLEERIAERLGKEAALFLPSGVMANEIALLLLAPPGSEVIVEATSHFFDWELGGPAVLGGIQLRPVAAPGGALDRVLVESAIRAPSPYQVQTSAVALENTHNAAGGRILPLENARGVADVARERGLGVHLDGARLWNASVATGIPERAWAECADTVMVTLSKGLGCPAGSVLAADAERIRRARTVRRRLGGAMRQAGILAAAGLYALDHNRDALAEDHRRARALADLLADAPGLDVVAPETNIVMCEITAPGLDAPALVARAAERGVLITVFTPTRVRAVTHRDVGDDDIRTAGTILRDLAG